MSNFIFFFFFNKSRLDKMYTNQIVCTFTDDLYSWQNNFFSNVSDTKRKYKNEECIFIKKKYINIIRNRC